MDLEEQEEPGCEIEAEGPLLNAKNGLGRETSATSPDATSLYDKFPYKICWSPIGTDDNQQQASRDEDEQSSEDDNQQQASRDEDEQSSQDDNKPSSSRSPANTGGVSSLAASSSRCCLTKPLANSSNTYATPLGSTPCDGGSQQQINITLADWRLVCTALRPGGLQQKALRGEDPLPEQNCSGDNESSSSRSPANTGGVSSLTASSSTNCEPSHEEPSMDEVPEPSANSSNEENPTGPQLSVHFPPSLEMGLTIYVNFAATRSIHIDCTLQKFPSVSKDSLEFKTELSVMGANQAYTLLEELSWFFFKEHEGNFLYRCTVNESRGFLLIDGRSKRLHSFICVRDSGKPDSKNIRLQMGFQRDLSYANSSVENDSKGRVMQFTLVVLSEGKELVRLPCRFSARTKTHENTVESIDLDDRQMHSKGHARVRSGIENLIAPLNKRSLKDLEKKVEDNKRRKV